MTGHSWWKDAVFYQVYPRSFNDGDGDGVGDIPGLIEKVDYLDELGVDAVWLSPVYESPMADYGYDVADYRTIDPTYGTMDDLETLREELHAREMRLVMDLVVNHTSDEHEWFERSRAGEEPYDEFYYWRESEDGPPNNWESFFGGSAWSYDDEREAYYLHLFDEKQPDLNWRNPAVREAVYEMMQWWLEKGIDGFRMDVVNLLSKPEGLPDGVPNDFQTGIEHVIDGPDLDRYLAEMHREVLAGRDVVAVGEMPGVDARRAVDFVGEDGPLSMVITFEHVMVDWGPDGRWDPVEFEPRRLADVLTTWQEAMAEDGWNCLYFTNHDHPRAVSRFGDDEEHRVASATTLATVLFTLRGTPFVYQGEEIGMRNASFPTPDDIDDVEARNFVSEALESDAYDEYEEVRPIVEARSRDNARTPVQWSDAPNAGFSDGEPWLSVADPGGTISVERAIEADDSIWHYYRDLIELRSDRQALREGAFERLDVEPDDVFAYERTGSTDRLWILANLGDERRRVELPSDAVRLVLSNEPEASREPLESVTLGPYESRIYEDS